MLQAAEIGALCCSAWHWWRIRYAMPAEARNANCWRHACRTGLRSRAAWRIR